MHKRTCKRIQTKMQTDRKTRRNKTNSQVWRPKSDWKIRYNPRQRNQETKIIIWKIKRNERAIRFW